MSNMSTNLKGAFLLASGVSSALFFIGYMSQPVLDNISIIKDEAKIVQEYNGDSPTEALDQAMEKVDLVKMSNPGSEQDFKVLEDRIMQYRPILDNKDKAVLYQPVLDIVSGDLEKFAKANSKNNTFLALGIGSAALSVFTGYKMAQEGVLY